MEDYLNDFEHPAKDASEAALRRWRDIVSPVKNPKRRFRFSANLDKRYEAENIRRTNQEKLRAGTLISKAALDFIQGIPGMKQIQLQKILSATNKFSDENLITEGRLGKMFKGRLVLQGQLQHVIVRRFYGQGDELQTEISMLSSLEHENIISLVGFCDEKDEKIIVYEQAFHGTLKQHLSDPTLTWSRRLHICLGVARALNHIHYDVIHCDINSSKIFLNKDWEPKIFGFELSTNYPQSWRHRFLFSHYFNTTSMTPKYDVYSFGLLMLEVLCGRKPVIREDGVKEEPGYFINQKQMNRESLDIFQKTAYDCLKQQLAERPTMDQIVKELEEALGLQWWNLENLGHLTAIDESTSSNGLKMDLLKIPLSEIRKATECFKDAYAIGCGGYGIVYKAQLDVLDIQSFSSMEEGKSKDELPTISKSVAIKRILSRSDEQGKQGFLTEIDLLRRCKHTNIVSLLGFSNEATEMILVYEYAFNGSLSDYLTSTRKINLTWVQRLQICLDIAYGLRYLHTNMEGKPRIIHRDIKSENILLDENLNAKVADFGLSKFHTTNQVSTIQTSIIAGTNYYLDPEFLSTGKYKRETDIYSFGVVLFEILCGRLAYDPIFTKENVQGLAPIARRRFNEGTLKELIDPTMIEEDDERIFTLNRGPNQDSFNVFSKVAYQCLAETQAKRPTMEAIIKELQSALKLQGETMVLSRFSIWDIELATEKFSETHCIGLDANGLVYKAEVGHFGSNGNGEPSKKLIAAAIKRFSGNKGGQQAFFEEIEMHTGYKHPNIVSLLGFSDEGDDMVLVYEHASNGSLDDYLKSVNNMNYLTWTRRLQMCLGIACGLDHLHTKMNSQQQRITHGDIRSANILLGENGEPKISYFGISKLNQANQEENCLIIDNSIDIKVYADPEYEKEGDLKKESDVYSFGVVLFEIFCGRLAYDPVYIHENDRGLASIACQCFKDGTIENIIDPKLKEETDEDIFTSNRVPNQDSLDTFLNIAYQCLGEAAKRPTLEIVIKELEKALNFQEILLKNFQVSLKDIESATGNFGQDNCVGCGRYWKAYKGELPFTQDKDNANRRTTIVAKRWDSNSGEGGQQFLTELDILFKRKHENIIGLVGYCNEINEKIIVYEHASNGSLDMHLGDANLTWMRRLKICFDVASGLDFLHRGAIMLKKAVHRDIKSRNILLYDDWKAKISNLELSSLYLLHQDKEHISDNAYGAFSYLDPEYKQGFLTEESDIYLFGVVLFEILCGRLAWAQGCEDYCESLGPLAKRCYKEGKLNEMVFEGIKEQIGPESLATFADIAYQCLNDQREERPTAGEVVIRLKKSLDAQEDYEIWESELPKDYKEIIQMSETPEIYSTAKRKDLYDILSKGILIQEGNLWFSLGRNGERNKMVSASQFSYENSLSHKWRSVPESRFHKIAEMLDISSLKIQIHTKTQLLSLGVNYGVHLIFRYCGARKSRAKQMYVNLNYKMGDEALHTYFATWRDDDWMMIELYRFLNHEDDADFEFLLESFSPTYCGSSAIYVEGVEFRAIENVKHEENNNSHEVHQVLNSTLNMDPVQQLPTKNSSSIFPESLLKLFSWRNTENLYMISAKEAFCDSSNVKLFNLKPSIQSRTREAIELLSTQVFHIKCKIDSQKLLPNTEYSCYLVFKLSEMCCELHCPVIVLDLHQPKNKQILYFRSPSPWNLNDVSWVPKEREDGWMEVKVWKFKSHYELQTDCISMNLKLMSYEGTMYGLIVCGLEFRPM